MSQVPIIAFGTTKGGSGKSTVCILVAGEIADRGENVLILDTDPQQSTFKWFERCKAAGQPPERIQVVPCLGEKTLGDQLKALPENGVVLIDTQGALTPALAIIASKADLIVVPSRATKMDVVEAAAFVKYTEHFRQDGVRLFINSVDAIAMKTAVFKEVVNYMAEEQIPYFTTMLYQRPIYSDVSDDKGTLATIKRADPESVRKARANVAALLTEILEELSDAGSAPAEVHEIEAA
jgi:chromosome partitioning protein